MKKLTTIALLIFATNAFADLECQYLRKPEGRREQVEDFSLSESRPSDERDLRTHSFKAKLEQGAFVIEVREKDEVKVVSQSVQSPWSKARQPSRPEASIEFKGVSVKVKCR